MAKKKSNKNKNRNITPTSIPQTRPLKPQPTSNTETRRFDKEMTKDVSGYHLEDNQWTHARNAINNSKSGDLGKIGNEPANKLCINAPYTIIGFVHLIDDKWAVFSTDNTDSEIGYFEEDRCRYTTIVNSPCLSFNQDHLIIGSSRENFECKHIIYWSDGINSDRYLKIGNLDSAPYEQPWPDVPYVCEDNDTSDDCIICEPVTPLTLNCEKTRLEPITSPICLRMQKGAAGGNLLNGSYYAVAAYSVDGNRVTDYFTPSNIQPIFDHLGVGGSVDIYIDSISDEIYDEFELVIVSVINQQTVATKVGTYSTRQNLVTIDIINQSLPTVPIEQLPIQNIIYDKSDAIYKVNDYMLRVGPSSKFQCNYQPLANQIVAQWRAVEYPEDYYKNGGNAVGYMRDEVYSFFIRWRYNDGSSSASFHIPGRPAKNVTIQEINNIKFPNGFKYLEKDPALANEDNIEVDLNVNNPKLWQQYNTAYETGNSEYGLCDGGIVVAQGHMGYWESSEIYPDDEPEIWNSSAHDWSSLNPPTPLPTPIKPYAESDIEEYDLCGKPIRHHRFPDNSMSPDANHFRPNGHPPAGSSNPNLGHIRIMGVAFNNIRPPVDNDGNLIPGIVGYEILRGSRKGNKSVIAKGMINNLVRFPTEGIPGFSPDTTGLFQNYPYNDLQGDDFLSKNKTRWNGKKNEVRGNSFSPYEEEDYQKSLFSFHSPETNFANPFLSPRELKIYEDLHGTAEIRYKYPDEHPKEVFIKDIAFLAAVVGGMGLGMTASQGKRVKVRKEAAPTLTSSGIFPVAGISSGVGIWPNPALYGAGAGAYAVSNAAKIAGENAYYTTGLAFLDALIGSDSKSFLSGHGASTAIPQQLASYPGVALGHLQPYSEQDHSEGGDGIPALFKAASGALLNYPTFLFFMSEGADQIIRLMYNLSRPQQHALQALSHCLYDDYGNGSQNNPRAYGETRRLIYNSSYIDNQISYFGKDFVVNNLHRGRFVALDLRDSDGVPTPLATPAVTDQSRRGTRLKDLKGDYNNIYREPEVTFTRASSSYYTALKQRLRNQYGQIPSIKQVPISCTIPACPTQSGVPPIGGGTGLVIGQRLGDGDIDLCLTDNILDDPNFADFANAPGTSPWVSNPSGHWIGATVTTTTLARSGQTQSAFNRLEQTFAAPLIDYDQYEISFNVESIDPGSQLNVYLGSSSTSPKYIANSAGSFVTTVPYVVDPTVTVDSIWFEAQGPIQPNTATWKVAGPGGVDSADFFTGTYRGLPYDCSGTTNPVVTINRVQFAGFGDKQNDIDNNIGQGAAVNGVYDPIVDYYGIPNGFITNIDCTSELSWNLQIAYRRKSGSIPPFGNTPCLKVMIRRIPTNAIGSLGVDIATLFSGSLTSTSVNLASAISSSPITLPATSPTDKYVIVAISNGAEWNVTGDMTLTTCVESYPLEITNVCMRKIADGPSDPTAVYGCTDPNANNFDPSATVDDGSCEYTGCMDPFAANYNPQANTPCDDCCDPPISGGIPLGGVDGPCGGHPCNAPFRTYTLFGGDTYVNRYTEKNSFFYFYDWLYGQPDRTEFDYLKYRNVPYPTYWYNSEGFSATEGITSIWDTLIKPSQWKNFSKNIINPSDYHVFDRPGGILNLENLGYIIRKGYIYLFNSGIRDFYVESEYNIDFREYGEEIEERHYNELGRDAYTDLDAMFSPKLIRAANYYKYNNSLSASRIQYEYANWSAVYPPYYDPTVAEDCYVYEPEKLIYSLPAQLEQVRDNWRIFLTNNYKKFLSPITAIKQTGNSGNIILFEHDSPILFEGVDRLETEGGVKFTIGDGGLFGQPGQNLSNADRAYQYGSCQNRRSVVNTIAGTYWISQNQGKIFELGKGLSEISMGNLKWWLAEYLPYQLTKHYPDYNNLDNPVTGIACQTIYDNENSLVYFSKKDYEPKFQNGEPIVSYDENGFYTMLGPSRMDVELGDPQYFKDASWTLSYDPKIKSWISYHDWHPDLVMPSKNTFMTTKGDGIWIHNDRCDLYCNYYEVDHPFEIEYTVNTIQDVQVLRSIEYQLEAYKYKFDSCYDRFHELDFNFDEAVIYNTEQCSGLLKLSPMPKNDPQLMLDYPIVSPVGPGVNGNIKILYSKEENKYRFNQFWDITNDRGEFPINAGYPPTGNLVPNTTVLAGARSRQTLWRTEPNGYIRNLRNSNLHYSKDPVEHKKFRHYTTSVLLRRKVSGSRKMLLSLVNNKTVKSIR